MRYCDDHSSLSSTTAVQNELFHILLIISLLCCKEVLCHPLLTWLIVGLSRDQSAQSRSEGSSIISALSSCRLSLCWTSSFLLKLSSSNSLLFLFSFHIFASPLVFPLSLFRVPSFHLFLSLFFPLLLYAISLPILSFPSSFPIPDIFRCGVYHRLPTAESLRIQIIRCVMCSRGLLICLRVPVQCTQSVSFSERGRGGGGCLFPGVYGFVLVCLSSGVYGLFYCGCPS